MARHKPHYTYYVYNPKTVVHVTDWVTWVIESSWIAAFRQTDEVHGGEDGGTKVTPYSIVDHHLDVRFKDGFECTYLNQGFHFEPMYLEPISLGKYVRTYLYHKYYTDLLVAEGDTSTPR